MNAIKSVTGRDSNWKLTLFRNDVTGALTWTFKIRELDGTTVTVRVPNELSPAQIAREIRGMTTLLPKTPKAAQNHIQSLQQQAGPPQRETTRAGWKWRSTEKRSHADLIAFATPARVIILSDTPYHWAGRTTGRAACIGAVTGDLIVYRTYLDRFSARSHYIAFATLGALAAPALKWAGLPESPLFNLHGESSTGKTLACQAGTSVQGDPATMESWDQKPRALEEQAGACNDQLFVVNAAERCPPRERHTLISRLTHMVPEGVSTLRSAVVQDRIPDLDWQCLTLSTSNAAGRVLAEGAGLQWEPQDAARFIDIPVPPVIEGGIFDRLPRDGGPVKEQASALVRELEETLPRHHGLLLEPWIRHLAKNDPTALIGKYVRHFLQRHGSPTGVEGRIAAKFAVVYAAGKIANTHAGLLGWPKNRPFRTVSTLYLRSVAARSGQPACASFLTTFAKLIADPKLVRRAPPGKTLKARRGRDLLAIKCRHDGQSVLGLRLVALKQHQPSDYRKVRTWLKDHGLAVHGQGGRQTTQVPLRLKIGGKVVEKPRLLLLRPKRLITALRDAGAVE